MTTERRLVSDLPHLLDEIAYGPYPEYIDDVLARTARQRQRPGWSFPGRWLPSMEPVLAPRLPWRAIPIALVLVTLLLAAAALIVGTQRRVPAPFGPAGNGVVAYDAGGDIYTANPVTGEARAIVSGPGTDVAPRFSLDGTRIVFERKEPGADSRLYVAAADGTNPIQITPEPIVLSPAAMGRAWERYEFSPDGRSVLISALLGGLPGFAIAQADGSGIRHFDLEMEATEPSFRPPDGREILFVGRNASGGGLFAFDPSTGTTRSILELPYFYDLAGASWSPDGSQIAYWSWTNTGSGMTAKSHVIAADGTGQRELPSPADAVWNAHATWSNDGTRLFIARGHTPGSDDVRGVVLPADGSSVGIEVAPAGMVETVCCAAWMWSPDDSTILGRPAGLGAGAQQVIIDVATRTARLAPWSATGDPAWQRVAP